MATCDSQLGEDVPKKKRGNQGDFHGVRLQFLEEHLQAYQAASKENTVRVWFQDTFFPSYWKSFHWSLPLNKDPSPSDVYPNDAENIEMKTATMKATTAKIKSWFNYRRNALQLNSKKNPWAQWLSQLGKPLDGPPRRPHDNQYYMRHPLYKPKVTEAFERDWPGSGLAETFRMSFRCKIAEELLRNETVAFQEQLTKEVDARYQADLEQYKQGISITQSEDVQDQEDAIESFAAIVQPLVDGLRAHTGMYVQLMAVAPSADSSAAKCICLSSGKASNGLDFSGQDAAGFRTFTRLFMRWAMVAEGLLPASTLATTITMDTVGSVPSIPTANGMATAGTQSPAEPRTRDGVTGPKETSQRVKAIPKAAPLPSSSSTIQRAHRNDISPEERARVQLEKAVMLTKAAVAAAGFEVGEELLTAIAKLPPSAKAKRISELAKMGAYERGREENIARNSVLVAQLGLSSAVAQLMEKNKHNTGGETPPNGDNDDYNPGASSPASKGKDKQIGEVRRSQRHTAGKNPAEQNKDETAEATDMDVDNNNDGERGGERNSGSEGVPDAREDVVNGSENGEGEEAVQVHSNEDDGGSEGEGRKEDDEPHIHRSERDNGNEEVEVPEWFSAAWTNFTSVKRESYGAQWFELLRGWKDWEKRNGYDENGEELSKLSRPPQIGTWIKSRRYYNRLPKILDPKVFADQWWRWWRASNPSWRVVDGSDSLSKDRDGPWDGVTATGINGLLSIIVGLWWWRERTADADPAIETWHNAVEDVVWVLQHGTGEELDGDERPRKRVRTS
ncbi:hypothetical protein PLEOSDRAFT_1107361 [Pleurotus ostreatus PC15]|uniref:Uncharacterized protein n=1 Tax=Pleurotus ostreatus (strain PC15) TaxID=1137138 RepID=A0A067NBW2_PLEO1|nr:hypothetical protein PLEOSDRAFT_1107361 [Pleurotus ostreatus PC15]